MKNIFIIYCLFILCMITPAGRAFCYSERDDLYPHGISKKLNREKIESLKEKLRNEEMYEAKRQFFDEVFDAELPDLFCYLYKDLYKNKNHWDGLSISLGLTKGKEDDSPILWGEQYLWVIFFVDSDFVPMTQRLRDTAFVITNSPLNFVTEPNESTMGGLIKALSTVFLKASLNVNERKEVLSVDTQKIHLQKMNDDDNTLWYGIVKFKIGLDTKNRISIKLQDTALNRKANFNFANYYFGNFEQSHFSIGLGLGATIGGVHDYNVFVDHGYDSANIGLYLFGHYYFQRPQPPVSYWNWGLVAGTSITPIPPFNDFVFGLRFGIVGESGLIVGTNFILNKEKVRKTGLFVGFDYTL